MENQQPGFVEQVQAQKDKQVQDLKHQQLVDGHAHTSNTVIAGSKAIIQHQENVVESMQQVADAIQNKVFDSNTLKSTLTDFGQKLDTFLKAIPNLPEPPEPVEDVKINNLSELEPHFKAIQKTLNKIAALEIKPEVNVAAAKIDLKPLTTLLGAIKTGIDNLKKAESKEDNTDLLSAINATTEAISSMRFPTANFMLPFKDVNGKDAQITLGSKGGIPISGGTLVPESFDYVAGTYPDAVTETYTYKSGGSGGTLVATVTVIYADSTKAKITSVTRT